MSHALASLLLTLIAGVLVGFAVLEGSMSRNLIESVVAALFVACALWALLTAPWMVPLGDIGHALWDFMHHRPIVTVKMPAWYFPACVVYGVLVVVGLWAI